MNKKDFWKALKSPPKSCETCEHGQVWDWCEVLGPGSRSPNKECFGSKFEYWEEIKDEQG